MTQFEPDALDKSDFLDQLRELGGSLSGADLAALGSPKHAFETTDSSHIKPINPEHLRRFRKIVEDIRQPEEPAYRVYKREIPLSHTIIAESQPDWATGLRPERTIGPITTRDGRKFWFDFFPIIHLVPLYLPGQSQPALLFYISQDRPPRSTAPSKVTSAPNRATYSLSESSLWVRADLLAASGPATGYVGFDVKSGEIVLSKAAQHISSKLTIPADATCSVSLNLQSATLDKSNASKQANDLKSAKLQTPDHFAFHFSQHQHRHIIRRVLIPSLRVYGRPEEIPSPQELREQWHNTIICAR